jgi:hypothetical protein
VFLKFKWLRIARSRLLVRCAEGCQTLLEVCMKMFRHEENGRLASLPASLIDGTSMRTILLTLSVAPFAAPRWGACISVSREPTVRRFMKPYCLRIRGWNNDANATGPRSRPCHQVFVRHQTPSRARVRCPREIPRANAMAVTVPWLRACLPL